MKRFLFFCFAIAISMGTSFQSVADSFTVKWGTDSWPGLTDGDGNALYDRLFSAAFRHSNMELDKQIMPFNRALYLAEKGNLDFAGGIEKFDGESPDYYQASFPVVELNTAIFYLSKTFPNEVPKSIDDVAGKKACASPEVAEQAGVAPSLIVHANDKLTALRMMLKERCAYYIDGEGEMKGTIAKLDGSYRVKATEQGRMSIVARISPHMVSPRSPRGKQVIDAYENGTIALYNSGELEQIYRQSGMSVPEAIISFVRKSN